MEMKVRIWTPEAQLTKPPIAYLSSSNEDNLKSTVPLELADGHQSLLIYFEDKGDSEKDSNGNNIERNFNHPKKKFKLIILVVALIFEGVFRHSLFPENVRNLVRISFFFSSSYDFFFFPYYSLLSNQCIHMKLGEQEIAMEIPFNAIPNMSEISILGLDPFDTLVDDIEGNCAESQKCFVYDEPIHKGDLIGNLIAS